MSLNPRGESYRDLVNGSLHGVFVDKTNFIGVTIERLDTKDKLIAFTRMRRSGKTLAAEMLEAYYSKGAVDNSYVFKKLNIANYSGTKLIDNQVTTVTAETYLNKFDVISVDMHSIDYKYSQQMRHPERAEGGKLLTVQELFGNYVIRDLKEQKNFARVLKKAGTSDTDLAQALIAIHKALGITFIFIMDEWDLIYREYREDLALQQSFTALLRSLFEDEECLKCFSLVYLTGIMPIPKYDSQPILTKFCEYNILTPAPYEEYFGFTEAEMATIVQQPFCRLSLEVLQEWFCGYKINGKIIYNPFSVDRSVSDHSCYSHWVQSSSNEEVATLINRNFLGLKRDIINLLEGESIPFSCEHFHNEMITINNRDDVFSLLVCLGYLGCTDTEKKYHKLAYVPNFEIKNFFFSCVGMQSWYHKMGSVQRSKKLLQAINDLDATTVVALLQKVYQAHKTVIASNYEQAITIGLQWAFEDDLYFVHDYYDDEQDKLKGKTSRYKAGRTRNPIVFLRFSNESATMAIKQMRMRKYTRVYHKYVSEFSYKEVEKVGTLDELYEDAILVGVHYCQEKQEYQCLIENVS